MLGCAPPSLMLLLMCVMPETPRFLLTQHRRQEAMAALRFLWGSEQGWEDLPIGAEQVRGWEAELTGVGQQSREGSTACSQGHTLRGQGGACPPSTLSEDSPSASCLRQAKTAGTPRSWALASEVTSKARALTLSVSGRERPGVVGDTEAELRTWI